MSTFPHVGLKLLLLALAGSAAAAPTLDRSHDQQPIWQHKVLHAWFCNHHPNSRWCQAEEDAIVKSTVYGTKPYSPKLAAPPPQQAEEDAIVKSTVYGTKPSPKLPGADDTPFQPRTKWDLQKAVNAWCTDAASAKITYGDIALWDVSAITDMSWLFRGNPQDKCNPDISKWDTGKVIYMDRMFQGATSFSADLSKWDTGKVGDMGAMFYEATSFSADLSKWDTGNVTDMSDMFAEATSFNADLSKWETGNVIHMYTMFFGATSFTEKKFCPKAARAGLVCPYQPGA